MLEQKESELVWLEPQKPNEIMDEAIKKYSLDKVYVLLSGGKDSVCVAHFIATNYPDQFGGCVFTNTGLGSQATRKFVIEYCKKMGWKLFMTWAVADRERFYSILMRWGFATEGNHRIWMGYLKQHTWYYFLRERIMKSEKCAFISGVRKKESKFRNKSRQYTKKPVDDNKGQIYIKPFLYKNGSQLWDYYNKHELEKSPVYEWLNRSGECHCGAFVEAWDLKMLEKHDPLAFETIKWYEKQIDLHGSPEAKRRNRWGKHYKASTKDITNQKTLDELFNKEVQINDDYCGESCTTDF